MASWWAKLSGFGIGGLVATFVAELTPILEFIGLIFGLVLTGLGIVLKWRQLRSANKRTDTK